MTQETTRWDEATVRECARKVLDCQMRDIDGTEPAMRIACSNQALMAYDMLMRMIEPDRLLAKSIDEARRMPPNV